MPARRIALIALAGALLAAPGCGGEEGSEPPSPTVPGDADPGDVRVIDAWARTLAAGDVEGAASYFAIPSIAENGPLIPIDDPGDALRFNAALPCGAELIRAETNGEFTTATFRLRERPGPGTCGAGTGQTAQTTFVITDGKIVEWRRVGLPGERPPGQSV